MYIWPDCIHCTLRMSLNIARAASKDDLLIKKFYEEILKSDCYKGNNWNITSPGIIRDVWLIMQKTFGTNDPFKIMKKEHNKAAMKIYPYAKEFVLKSPDPFLEALRFSISGNSIDIMTGPIKKPSKKIIKRLQSGSIDLKQVETFKERLAGTERLVYISDNCGEIVFDKLLIETVLKKYNLKITFVTRKIPILNDATKEDALFIGMDKVATVIDNGTSEPIAGTMLKKASGELKKLINESDLIISKGGGNYDLLTEENKLKGKCTFLLQAKCDPYCIKHQTPPGSLIVYNF
jgi:damage-control phosphatase, subfamily I